MSQTGRLEPGEKGAEPAYIALLKKLDGEREKRNKKRQELRDAGKETSDDEEDLVTAFLSSEGGVNQPANGPGQGNDEGGENGGNEDGYLGLEGPHTATDILIRDEDALNGSFQENITVFPQHFSVLATCKISPPLTLFRPDILKGIRLNTNVKMKKMATGATTSVRVLDTDAYPSETGLDSSAWQSTYNTFLAFIQRITGPVVYAGFAKHFDRMIGDPQFERWYPAFREFDRELRSEFFAKAFVINPSDADYRSRLQSAKDDFILSSKQESPTGVPQPPRNTSYNSSSPHPYIQTTRSSFRAQLCLRCGGADGHKAQACTASQSNRHGRSLIIKAGSSGLFRITDSKAVCYNFNLRGCPITGPSHALHICTLCGDPHHGASNCTRN